MEPAEIQFHEKIASGAFGDLYKGTYCGQDVAIKIVRNVQNDTAQFQEFLQVCCGCVAWPCFCSHQCTAVVWVPCGCTSLCSAKSLGQEGPAECKDECSPQACGRLVEVVLQPGVLDCVFFSKALPCCPLGLPCLLYCLP